MKQEWALRFGSGDTVVNFRGKGGQVRQLRRDECVISNEEEVKIDTLLGSVDCNEVLGRKAWRVDAEGRKVITEFVEKMNNGEHSSLEILEAMERKFESWK